MKSMKKFKIILLIILSAVVISTKEVMAADCTGLKFYPDYSVYSGSVFYWDVGGGIYKYQLKDVYGNKYTPYCRQPGYRDYWGTTYECVEVVADPSQKDGGQKKRE